MALAIDATATATAVTAGAASLDNTNLTVGAGATGLLAVLVFNEVSLIPAGSSLHWDSAGTNQTMTMVTTSQDPDFNGEVQIWALVNPTAGNKTLHGAWTGSVPAVLNAISFTGGITTSVATAFVRSSTAGNNVSSTPTLTLTGASGNISVCVYDDDSGTTTSSGLTATGSTAWFNNSSQSRLSVRGATAPSAATVTWTGAPTSAEWCIAGVDVVAASGTSFSGQGNTAGAGAVSAAIVAELVGSTMRW